MIFFSHFSWMHLPSRLTGQPHKNFSINSTIHHFKTFLTWMRKLSFHGNYALFFVEKKIALRTSEMGSRVWHLLAHEVTVSHILIECISVSVTAIQHERKRFSLGKKKGGHISTQHEGSVFEWVSNEGDNQLYMVERTSCYGPQLHIWFGLQGLKHMLKSSARGADLTVHSCFTGNSGGWQFPSF